MKHCYTITSLAPLPLQGQPPQLSPPELIDRITGHPDIEILLQAVFERVALQNETPSDDARWFLYYRALLSLGQAMHSPFLTRFAHFETTLASLLSQVRTRRTPELKSPHGAAFSASAGIGRDCAAIVSLWANADDPVTAHRLLLQGTRAWIEENGQWFSFGTDEIVAYAAALRVVIEAAVLDNTLPPSAMVFAPPVHRWRWSELE